MKSPLIKSATRPLDQIQAEWHREYEEAKKEYERANEEAELLKQASREQYKSQWKRHGTAALKRPDDAPDCPKLRLGRGRFIGPAQDRLTMDDLFAALETDYETNQRRSLTTLRGRLFHLRAAFGAMKAVDVNEQKIEQYKQERLADKTRRGSKPIRTATVNRELWMLRKAFRLALRHKRIATLPAIDLLDGEKVRHGFVEPGDFERLIIALPDHLKDFTRFAYITGWRIGEIRSLEWLKVNRDAQSIFLGYSKNGEPRILPLVSELKKIIDRRWKARTVETKDGSTILASHVFHNGDGTVIGDFRKTWATARAKAGLPGVLFHDLRRSAVRNLDRSGVTQAVGMMISGHKTPSVYKRYRIVPENDIREALEKVQNATERERKKTRVVDAAGAKGK